MKKIFSSMRYKLIITYLLVIIVPLSIAGVLLYRQTVGTMVLEMEKELVNRVQKRKNDIEEKQRTIETAAARFSLLQDLHQYIDDLYIDEVDRITSYNTKLSPAFSWFSTTMASLRRVGVFLPNGGKINNIYFKDSNLYAEQPWYQKMEWNLIKEKFYWEEPHLQRNYPYMPQSEEMVYSLFYQIPTTQKAVIEIEIRVADMVGKGENFFYYLEEDGFQRLGKKLSNQDQITLGAMVQKSLNKGGVIKEVFFEEPVFAYAIPVSGLSTVLLEVFPQADYITEVDSARRTFIGVYLLIWVFLVVFLLFVSHGITRNLVGVTKGVRQISNGNYNVRLPVKTKDEMGMLASSVNEMAWRIDHLLNEVMHMEIVNKEAEIRALQSQMNPHFIYNILETFRMMAELENQLVLAEGLLQMGALMRYNLSSMRTSTIAKEMENLYAYVEIQNLLHNGQITVYSQVDPCLANIPLPRLLLQPIVENAIVHGIEGRRPLKIFLTITEMKDHLKVEIKNNGKPISTERVKQIELVLAEAREKPEALEDDCFALANVQRRLVLSGAKDHTGIYIESKKGITSIVLILPLAKTMEGDFQNAAAHC